MQFFCPEALTACRRLPVRAGTPGATSRAGGNHVPGRFPGEGGGIADGCKALQVALPGRNQLVASPVQGSVHPFADCQQQEMVDHRNMLQMFGQSPGIGIGQAPVQPVGGRKQRTSRRLKVESMVPFTATKVDMMAISHSLPRTIVVQFAVKDQSQKQEWRPIGRLLNQLLYPRISHECHDIRSYGRHRYMKLPAANASTPLNISSALPLSPASA